MNILGISAYYHDSAACLMVDNELVAAAQEERFTRIKNDPGFPIESIRFCMEERKLSINDIDCVAYYEDPVLKLSRQLWSGNVNRESLQNDVRFEPGRPEREIRMRLGYEGPIQYFNHHQSHAASSFYFSGFDEASILTMDGVGEWTTMSYGTGDHKGIHLLNEISFPDSPGLLYSTITSYLGFEVNEGEYKVMGLAPYGSPKYKNEFRKLIHLGPGYEFRLNMEYFDFVNGKAMYSDLLPELFGAAPRKSGGELTQFHKDVSSSLQKILEEIVVEKSTYLFSQTGIDRLCLSGGVALNCVANRAVLNRGVYKKIFVPPGSNDSGCAIGAAALASRALFDGSPRRFPAMKHAYLGPEFDPDDVRDLIRDSGFAFGDYRGNTSGLLEKSAALIDEGKVLGWFQGRMEFGPRALGARSILADPRNGTMRSLINSMVKKREGFRPFAPVVTEEDASKYFDIDHPSPFMLETCPVKSGMSLPAVTHVDGSARLQTVARATNPKFYDLLKTFEKKSGCPVLLNTSFNVNKEPVVCSPADALKGFVKSNIDALVIEDFIIERANNNIDEFHVKLLNNISVRDGIVDTLYTFI